MNILKKKQILNELIKQDKDRGKIYNESEEKNDNKFNDFIEQLKKLDQEREKANDNRFNDFIE